MNQGAEGVGEQQKLWKWLHKNVIFTCLMLTKLFTFV